MSERRRECEELREQLAEHAAGTLQGRARTRVEGHVATCGRCAAELTDLRAVLSAVRSVLPEAVPEGLPLRASRAAYQAGGLRPGVPRVWTRIAVPAAAAAVAVMAATFALRGPGAPQVAPSRAPTHQVAMRAEAPSASPEMELRAGLRARQTPAVREQREALARVGPGRPGALSRARGAASPSAARMPREPAAEAAPGAAPKGETQAWGGRASAARDELGGRPALRPRGNGRLAGSGGTATPARRMGMGVPRHGPGVPVESARACEGGVCPGLGDVAPNPKAVTEREELGLAAAVPPVSAHATLIQKEGRSVVGLRLAAEEKAGRVRVRVGSGTESRVIWQGLRPREVSIALTGEDIGPGPGAIPVRVESEAGVREYMLFVPTMAKLGQSAVGTPRVRYENQPLQKVLADLSALTGLVLLAEGPLDRKVVGELATGSPESALRGLAEKADLEVEGDGDVVRTLTHRR